MKNSKIRKPVLTSEKPIEINELDKDGFFQKDYNSWAHDHFIRKSD